ncbi:MAG: hypothetical protein WCY11_05110 [Novosphingobium sp.]
MSRSPIYLGQFLRFRFPGKPLCCGSSGSPSRIATNEQNQPLNCGKQAETTNGIPPSPAPVGKPEDAASRCRTVVWHGLGAASAVAAKLTLREAPTAQDYRNRAERDAAYWREQADALAAALAAMIDASEARQHEARRALAAYQEVRA